MRLDRQGRDVTDSPGLWSEEDCEIVATQYSHPGIASGQHTNGPASIWIRLAESDEWHRSQERSMHKTREAWIAYGIKAFTDAAPTAASEASE